MTEIHAARQFVLSRLGAPAPLLPGERYRYRSPELGRIYARFDRFIERDVIGGDRSALPEFVTELERWRERDYVAFHYGRELLLDNLGITVGAPASDPEPLVATGEPRKRPRWSRRSLDRAEPKQLRARVLAQLGRPQPRLPGEGYMVEGSEALYEVHALLDELELVPELGVRAVVDAVARLARVRERDWQAFYMGRSGLLSMLPVEVEVPPPPSRAPALAPAPASALAYVAA